MVSKHQSQPVIYPVVDIFHSIQGEGEYVGMPVTFVRLAYCNLSCAWCDTDHAHYNPMTVQDIIRQMDESIVVVVLTGGEPTINNLKPLVTGLKDPPNWKTIHLETNGVIAVDNPVLELIDEEAIEHITLSPKAGFPPHHDIVSKANEIKVVLQDGLDPEDYARERSDLAEYGGLYIQPMSENFQPAYEYVMKHPWWRLSIQVHKVIKCK